MAKNSFGVWPFKPQCGRWEENFLTRSRFFDKNLDRSRSLVNPDSNLRSAGAQYQEIYASVALPGTRGHRLIAGVARTELKQKREFSMQMPVPPVPGRDEEVQHEESSVINRLNSSSLGPMIGMEGGKSVGRLGLNWSGRIYPRMSRTDTDHFNAGTTRLQVGGYSWSSSTYGFELRGTVSYQLAEHVALTGGYQHRQFYKPDQFPSQYWVVNETQAERGFLGGLKFVF